MTKYPWWENMKVEWRLQQPGTPACRFAGHVVTWADAQLDILNSYSPSIERWLDAELVSGSEMVREVFALFLDFGDFSHLGPDYAEFPFVKTFKRLKGLQ